MLSPISNILLFTFLWVLLLYLIIPNKREKQKVEINQVGHPLHIIIPQVYHHHPGKKENQRGVQRKYFFVQR